MSKRVGIECQDFEAIRTNGNFYIDKTRFIREWWDQGDSVTLITRPRRFGKTLNMSMLECFFSNNYADRGDLFEGLSIWKEAEYRKLQGKYPVLFLSFADIKSGNWEDAVERIKKNIADVYALNHFLLKEEVLTDVEKEQFLSVKPNMKNVVAETAIREFPLSSEY